jgi:hypothetical protein
MRKTSSLIVTFHTVTTKEVEKFLKEHNVSGTNVSSIIPRWAVDVPSWKEKELISEFLNNELVKSVHVYVDKFTKI